MSNLKTTTTFFLKSSTIISDYLCRLEDANQLKYDNDVNILHTACIFLNERSINIVKLILTLDTDCSAIDVMDVTPLHHLCKKQQYDKYKEEIMKLANLLFSKGTSCSSSNAYDETPLRTLCKYRRKKSPLNFELIKLYCQEKSVINANDNKGNTPLHLVSNYRNNTKYESFIKEVCINKRAPYYASWRHTNDLKAVKYLFAHGGKPSLKIKNKLSLTPYQTAIHAGFRKPYLCCGIICCNAKLDICPPRCCSKCKKKPNDPIDEDPLLTFAPLENSNCSKLSYCCWTTRTSTKFLTIFTSVMLPIMLSPVIINVMKINFPAFHP